MEEIELTDDTRLKNCCEYSGLYFLPILLNNSTRKRKFGPLLCQNNLSFSVFEIRIPVGEKRWPIQQKCYDNNFVIFITMFMYNLIQF